MRARSNRNESERKLWSLLASPCLFLSAVWSGNYDRNGLVLGPLAVNNEGFPDQMSYVGCSSFRQASYPYNHHPFLTLLTTYDSDDDWLRKGMLMTDTQPLKTWVSRCYHITFGHKWCYLVSHLSLLGFQLHVGLILREWPWKEGWRARILGRWRLIKWEYESVMNENSAILASIFTTLLLSYSSLPSSPPSRCPQGASIGYEWRGWWWDRPISNNKRRRDKGMTYDQIGHLKRHKIRGNACETRRWDRS